MNPFEDVHPVGEVNVGKRQLCIREARCVTDAALRLFLARGDRLALGALAALLLGRRTSEVRRRTTRDLDDEERVLWTHVCPHSLRGLHATLAVESGVVSDMVAASLGHGSFAVTQRHYAQESTVRGARAQRVSGLIARPAAAMTGSEPDAAELLRALPTETLARLLALATARRAETDANRSGIDPTP